MEQHEFRENEMTPPSKKMHQLDTHSLNYFSYILSKWKGNITDEASTMILFLNSKNQILDLVQNNRSPYECGNIDIAPVLNKALRRKANKILVAENKIVGETLPNWIEIQRVSKLSSQLQILSIKVFDYLFFSKNGYCSFKDNDFFKSPKMEKVPKPVVENEVQTLRYEIA